MAQGSRRIEFVLTRADIAAANGYTTRRQLNRRVWFILLGCPIIFALGDLTGGHSDLYSMGRDAIGGLITGFFLWLVLPPALGVVASLRLRDGTYSAWLSPRQLEISNDGVHINTPTADSFTRWPGVVDIVQAKKALYMYVTSSQMIIVPKRAFAGDEPAFEKFSTAAKQFRAAATTE